MAFGTPTDGGAAYSAQNGTSVSPAYPAGIQANDIVVLIVGQKPSTANGGTVTTPTGWTLRESITGQGGYGTTLAADSGNTNLFIYTKDVVAGTETGNLSITVGTNNVCWALIMRIPGGGATSESFGSADGGRATAPTTAVAFTNLLTNGATAPNFEVGDLAIWAMCIPTDVLGGTGFSAPTISATGATFATPTETEEPSSGTGNDIGGFVAYAAVTAGTSTAAPTVGATATGTVTNVRGPLILLRIRETSQTLTQDARFNNANTFFTATATKGAASLAPNRYNNTNAFYTPAITQQGGGQSLNPALYANDNTFFGPTLTKLNTLVPARYNNTNAFYTPSITATITLTAALYTNANAFFAPTITKGAITLSPARYDNANAFYSPVVATGAAVLAPSLYTNASTFFAPAVTSAITLIPARYDNVSAFYSPTITQTIPGQQLLPNLYSNTNAFYAPTAAASYTLRFEGYEDTGYVDPGYTGLALQSANQFFPAVLAGGTVTIVPSRYDNDNTFFAASVVVPGQSSGNFFAVF